MWATPFIDKVFFNFSTHFTLSFLSIAPNIPCIITASAFKSDFRKLWIKRINAAVRVYALSYSQFMFGLKQAGITVNRKMLSELAIHDETSFKTLVETAKKNLKA
jgi:hypothetical protein